MLHKNLASCGYLCQGTHDLKRYLEKSGVSKDMIKRAVTISANHLSTRDYEGIVKGVEQIPLMYFEPEPQAGGSAKASVVRPAAVTTKSNLSKPRNSFKKTSSSGN